MSGLIRKDFLVARKVFRTYVLFILVYLGMALSGMFSVAVVTSMLMVIIMMVPLSAFSCDEASRWDRYAMCLPLGRRKVVQARYIFTLILVLVTMAVGMGLMGILVRMGKEEPGEGMATVGTLVILGIGMVDVMLPLCYRFGAERARPFLIVILVAPTALILLLIRFGESLGFRLILDFLDRLEAVGVWGILGAGTALALLGMGLSCAISCRVMARKEY